MNPTSQVSLMPPNCGGIGMDESARWALTIDGLGRFHLKLADGTRGVLMTLSADKFGELVSVIRKAADKGEEKLKGAAT